MGFPVVPEFDECLIRHGNPPVFCAFAALDGDLHAFGSARVPAAIHRLIGIVSPD